MALASNLDDVMKQIAGLETTRPSPRTLDTAEAKMWKDHWDSVADFNAHYYDKGANKNIDEIVENSHASFFEKIKGYAANAVRHGLSYAGRSAGKVLSIVPARVRYAAVPVTLAGLLVVTGCNGKNTPTPTPTTEPTQPPIVTPSPTPEPTPKSTYELASEKLDYQTAQHWKGVARNYNSEQAINELAFLPEEGRLVLAEDIKAYTADRNISDTELSDLADPDRDGIISSEDANPMDPSNTAESTSPITFSFVRNLIKYNNSQGNENTLPQIYSGLENVIYVVEKHPKIVNGLNVFGNDALALLLADNPDMDMDKYWFLTNATALQAQDFFYVANEIMWDGRFKDRMQGPLTNGRFDEKEREVTNGA
jgi:hypothetical protein